MQEFINDHLFDKGLTNFQDDSNAVVIKRVRLPKQLGVTTNDFALVLHSDQLCMVYNKKVVFYLIPILISVFMRAKTLKWLYYGFGPFQIPV